MSSNNTVPGLISSVSKVALFFDRTTYSSMTNSSSARAPILRPKDGRYSSDVGTGQNFGPVPTSLGGCCPADLDQQYSIVCTCTNTSGSALVAEERSENNTWNVSESLSRAYRLVYSVRLANGSRD